MDESLAGVAARVRFPAGFLRRVELLVGRLAAARERREGAGRARLAGAGEEFVGYRPYRPGEDLRHLDWTLLARLDRPFVRVLRREASERWTLVLDASASMGVGPPGKLQRAAELAFALTALALKVGAVVRVVVPAAPGAGAPRALVVRRRPDLLALTAFCEATRAEGRGGLGALLTGASDGASRGAGRSASASRTSSASRSADAALGSAGRVVLLGDLFDVEPRAVLALARPGRELAVLRLLAPHELAPGAAATGLAPAVRWVDPESGETRERGLDAATRAGYERALETELERWDALCARHGVLHGTWSTARSFEEILRSAELA